MALSPNYGWSEPDNASLVKDGAQAMRTLGDAIDTSVWNIGFGQAGKNKLINGDFNIWQRGTSFTAYGAYWADRWTATGDRTSPSFTRQTFTPASAPVAGYEGQFYGRWVPGSSGSFSNIQQRIEDVRTFAAQSVTLSYWARISTGTLLNEPFIIQNFGSGGSAEVSTALTTSTITTTWTRYTHSFTVPTISGKTLGAGSYLSILPLRFTTASTANVDIWGVQIEYGSKATPFQTASGGSPQAELAICQRYYTKSYAQATTPATNTAAGALFSYSGTAANNDYVASRVFPVTMRTVPTVTVYGKAGTAAVVSNGGGADLAANSGLATSVGETGFNIYNGSGGSITPTFGGFVYHYVASAEL